MADTEKPTLFDNDINFLLLFAVILAITGFILKGFVDKAKVEGLALYSLATFILMISAFALVDRQNMGKPIQIIKIINYLIGLKKKINPNFKYTIQEIGLQKGEKMTEKLYINKNKLSKMNKNIYKINEENFSKIDFEIILKKLIHFSNNDLPLPAIKLIKKVLIKEIR